MLTFGVFIAWVAMIIAIIIAVIVVGAIVDARQQWLERRAEHAARKAEQSAEPEHTRQSKHAARVTFVALLIVAIVAALLITPRVVSSMHAQGATHHSAPAQSAEPPVYYLAHCTPQGYYKTVMTDNAAVVDAERAYGFWQIPASFYAEITSAPTMYCDAGPNDLNLP